MFRKIFAAVLTICITTQIYAQNYQDTTGRLSLLFIGDIMGHDEQIWSAENRETHDYNYDDVLQYVKDEISEADIAIANFEVTLGGAPYTGYPQFSSPAALAAACKKAGIDCFVTANNHAADRGKKGITGTIARLDSLGITHTGTFADIQSRDTLYPLIIEKKGRKLALLNYTFSTNGINVPQPVIVNMLDKSLIAGDLEKARSENPDAIIVFLHWGNEYDTIPTKAQTDMAEYLFSRGADLVIGSHPHVLQRMEWIKGDSGTKDKPVIYSLGNFVSNQRRPKTDGGAMVRIEMAPVNGKLMVADAGYYLTWVYTPIVNYRKKFYVLPCSVFENKPDFFSRPSDYQQMKLFLKGARSLLYKQNKNINELIFSGNNWLY
jgi:poly-gamma-glutamate capsule biosynthesis protein CapA/YwtB (metallophosphatase superfamily)